MLKNKKTAKQLKKDERRKNRGFVKVTVQHDCGCCAATMRFFSKKSAEKAFAAAGLQNSATITDDQGLTLEGIDTFYGFFVPN